MTEQEIRKYLRRIEEENSQTALRSFYNLCFDRFFRIAYYYLHTEEWAQEVVLDVFLKIWERRDSQFGRLFLYHDKKCLSELSRKGTTPERHDGGCF